MMQFLQRIKAWLTDVKRGKTHSALKEQPPQITDEVAEAMASRMKFDAERHRERSE